MPISLSSALNRLADLKNSSLDYSYFLVLVFYVRCRWYNHLHLFFYQMDRLIIRARSLKIRKKVVDG